MTRLSKTISHQLQGPKKSESLWSSKNNISEPVINLYNQVPPHVWQWGHCIWNWLWLLFQALKCQLRISNTINPHFLKSTLHCPMQQTNHELWLSGFQASVCLLVLHSYPSRFAKPTDAVIIMNADSSTF